MISFLNRLIYTYFNLFFGKASWFVSEQALHKEWERLFPPLERKGKCSKCEASCFSGQETK